MPSLLPEGAPVRGDRRDEGQWIAGFAARLGVERPAETVEVLLSSPAPPAHRSGPPPRSPCYLVGLAGWTPWRPPGWPSRRRPDQLTASPAPPDGRPRHRGAVGRRAPPVAAGERRAPWGGPGDQLVVHRSARDGPATHASGGAAGVGRRRASTTGRGTSTRYSCTRSAGRDGGNGAASGPSTLGSAAWAISRAHGPGMSLASSCRQLQAAAPGHDHARLDGHHRRTCSRVKAHQVGRERGERRCREPRPRLPRRIRGMGVGNRLDLDPPVPHRDVERLPGRQPERLPQGLGHDDAAGAVDGRPAWVEITSRSAIAGPRSARRHR